MPVVELHNIRVPLEAVWGSAADSLRDDLRECGTPESMFRLLEHALLPAATKPRELHPAVQFSLRQFRLAPRAVSVADVIEQTGIVHRRFIELFKEEVGMTPQKMRCLFRCLDKARG